LKKDSIIINFSWAGGMAKQYSTCLASAKKKKCYGKPDSSDWGGSLGFGHKEEGLSVRPWRIRRHLRLDRSVQRPEWEEVLGELGKCGGWAL
jgi:hypothetical protein